MVGIADPLRIGFNTMALVGVRVRPGTIEQVCRAVAELPQTSYVAMVTGSFDVFVEVICRDPEDFRTFLTEGLHAIDGVLGAESFIILELHKLAYGWGVASADPAPRLLGSGKPGKVGR
ncbi:MAG TPA: Lrp/AsnC ligand binding domain-containing protein [Candidatus Angelobacter sp.]|nr:Lrp/AsnC ligand binding domain-containing protein [Candidatus Angelobacter sp.]